MLYLYEVILDRVIDGDTVDVIIDLGFYISIKKRIRFARINAPETRTRDLLEKKAGLITKQAVIDILPTDTPFFLQSLGVGVYGRVLGELYVTDPITPELAPTIIDGIKYYSLNQYLLDNNLAELYDG